MPRVNALVLSVVRTRTARTHQLSIFGEIMFPTVRECAVFSVDEKSNVKTSEIDDILAGGVEMGSLSWEASIKNQQQYLILRFGVNVNLGNIPPEDILVLESLRQGLRGDTLKRAYLNSKGGDFAGKK